MMGLLRLILGVCQLNIGGITDLAGGDKEIC